MAEPACTLVREELREVAETGETYYYYPRSAILRVLNSNDNLRRVYLCDCASCRTDFNIGPDARLDNRHQTLDPEALLGNYATVYALLICSQRPGLIRYFQKHRTFLHGTTFFTRENLEFLTSESVRRTRSIIDDILRDQYSFQIRVMERSLEPITIHPREMLPIRQDRQEIGRGSFGQVFGFEFSYDEYRGKGLQHATRFARKIFFNSLNSSDVDAGLTEWFNNLQLERLQHGHLMPALMAFWHEGRFSIVFEQAQQTLDAYLESDGSLYSHEALWQQVQGLAAGLAHLHGNGTEVIAHHGDLKPANILIVNGVMKIADFGLLQIHHRAQLASNQPLTSDSYQLASTRPYAGPSGDKALMDVWSFGAILSEIATFNLEDSNALDRFRHSRLEDFPRDAPGFRTKGFHHDGRLKPSVARTIDELYELVRGGRQTQHGVHISQFQQHFFTEDFFSLLHQMLSDRLAECPSSQHVANTLERLQQQATQFQQHPVDRSDQRGDIWGDFTAGLVLPGTQGLGYRLEMRRTSGGTG
ncbi:kinase-like domain-containing protein [Aspergillus granulosus]|uniref:Kinase-like domain-containing protein n=1 Tax=Aspergillus granulosus TaxID=176169 RepID=A0ABR4I575_9EURO